MKANQRPTFQLLPRGSEHADQSDADDAISLASAVGLNLDDWQKLVVRSWLATDRQGRLLATDAVVVLPRQNGKTAVMEAVEVFKAVVEGRRVLHTAHEIKTARRAFAALQDMFDERRNPELASMVKTIRQTNGQEAILLANGGSIEFIARSKSSGRGFTVDDLILDEAQELTDEQLEALRPTISAAPSGDPQTIFAGTPTPPTSPGTVLLRMFQTVHGDTPPTRLAWDEWAVDKVGDVSDVRRWKRVNPAFGIRLREDTIGGELASFGRESFARERLGWWDVATDSDTDFPVEDWKACATDHPADGLKAWAVKWGFDGQVSLAVAVKPANPDDNPHVELVDRHASRDGVKWLVDFLTGPDPDKPDQPRWRTSLGIAVDGHAGAAILFQQLEEAGVWKRTIRSVNARNLGESVAMFEDAVRQHALTQFSQPQVDAAILRAKHRPIGKSGLFGFSSSSETVSTDPLEAEALAFALAKTSRRKPGVSKQKAWRA